MRPPPLETGSALYQSVRAEASTESLKSVLPHRALALPTPASPRRLSRAFTLWDDIISIVSGRLRAFDPTTEDEFVQIYGHCQKYTMTSWKRMYALYSSINYAVDARIAGDIVECGVWRGGSMMLAARTLMARSAASRRIFCYDTFSGMVEPGELDRDGVNQTTARRRWRRSASDSGSSWNSASLAEVKSNLASTGYPAALLRFVQGPVEDTIPGIIPDRISILRLDTDWHASTLHELRHLYPRLVRGGVLILDDYGYWLGAKDAADEYFSGLPNRPLLSRIDYSGRIAIRTDDPVESQ